MKSLNVVNSTGQAKSSWYKIEEPNNAKLLDKELSQYAKGTLFILLMSACLLLLEKVDSC